MNLGMSRHDILEKLLLFLVIQAGIQRHVRGDFPPELRVNLARFHSFVTLLTVSHIKPPPPGQLDLGYLILLGHFRRGLGNLAFAAPTSRKKQGTPKNRR